MLSPDIIAKARQAAGAGPLPVGGNGSLGQPKSLVDQLGLNDQAQGGTSTEAPAAAPNMGQLDAEQVVQGTNKIKSAISEGADKFAAEPNDGSFGTELHRTGDLLETGLGAAAGAVQAIFAPFTAAMKSAGNTTDIHPMQAFADSSVGKAFADWSNAHPEMAKNLTDALTVGGAALGDIGEANPLNTEINLKQIPGQVKDTLGEGVDAVKGKVADIKTAAGAKAATEESQGVLDAIRPTEDTMTPTEKKMAIEQGRQTIKNTKLGGTEVDYTPTKEIQRAAEILQDKNVIANPVKASDAANVVVAKTKLAISRLGQEGETYLDKNPVKITNKEDFDLFKKLREDADKVSTQTEMNAYDEQVKLFQKQLQGRPGGYTTANYYKALKDWESNIAEKLPRGRDALIDPTGVANAKIRAASDIRTAVRDLIGSKHTEFKAKMHDLASLYEAKDSAIINASKVKTQSLPEAHPKISKAVKIGAGAIIGDKLVKGATGFGL